MTGFLGLQFLFKAGIPVDVAVNIFINSFGSIQETTMGLFSAFMAWHIAISVPFNQLENAFIRCYIAIGMLLDQLYNKLEFTLPGFAGRSDAVPAAVLKVRYLGFSFFLVQSTPYMAAHPIFNFHFSVFRLSITLSCPLDLTLFPMDTQRCKMQLESFGYTTDDLRFIWQSGDPVQLEKIALPQFDIKKEDIEYGNCTKYYKGTGK
ncbi:UNVERIFIED_CONTAM: hypothetical protein H355_004905 [Colinus virginianus]|nr:hypothetical protein H355_004905 [Colinus virginianus]